MLFRKDYSNWLYFVLADQNFVLHKVVTDVVKLQSI